MDEIFVHFNFIKTKTRSYVQVCSTSIISLNNIQMIDSIDIAADYDSLNLIIFTPFPILLLNDLFLSLNSTTNR